MAAGLCSVGADVIQLGVVPTPAVPYLAGKYKADAGAVISACHNIARVQRHQALRRRRLQAARRAGGARLRSIVRDRRNDAAQRQRRRRHRHASRTRAGAGGRTMSTISSLLHVPGRRPRPACPMAVDCANGASGVGRPPAGCFAALGADVTASARPSPTVCNINDRLRLDASWSRLRAVALEQGPGAIGVAFDGDADRMLARGRRRERSIDGDVIMTVCALDMRARGVLYRRHRRRAPS